MRRLGNMLALLCAIAVLAVGCGIEQPPVNRVGVNVVEKSAFTGSWYMHQTIIDMEYEGAPTGFVGANAGDATGGFLGFSLPRIRWVIDENFLYAYRDYETVGDPTDPFAVRGDEDEDYLGQPVAAFAIESHFDIRRTYNSVTGEEQNVVVENTTDRHWYERQFMRVDWSQNLVNPTFEAGGGFVGADSAPMFVQDESRFPSEWRPQFHFMSCEGTDDESCDADDQDYAMDYDQGDMYSFSFVNQALLRPAQIPFFGFLCRWSDDVENFFPSAPECATVSIFIRTSFLRVSDRHEYEAVGWTNDRFNRAGYFALDRTTYDRTHDAGDPSYGVTDFTNQSANRHNIWLRWFQRDGDGNIMRDEAGRPLLLPYEERGTRQIVWYASREVPAHLIKSTYEVASEWNHTFMQMVRNLKGEATPQYAPVDCQRDDPGGYCYCQEHPDTGEVLNPTCAGRYDPFESPTDAAGRITSGEAYDCYVATVDAEGNVTGDAMANEPDFNNLGLSDSDFNPWFNTAMVGSECINVLRMNTCHLGNQEEWGNLDCQNRGDVRYKLLSYVDQPGTPFLGVAQLRGDPLTGRVVTGDANIGGPAMQTQRTRALEAYDLINGNITEQEYYTGQDVRAYLESIGAGSFNPEPRIDFRQRAATAGLSVNPAFRAGMEGVMNRAWGRAQDLEGPEGRAAIYSDRLHTLAGTDIERRLASGQDAFAMAGFDALPEGMSADLPTEDALEAMSPFRLDFGERYLEMQDQQLRMGLQNMILPTSYTDDSVLFFVNQHRDWSRVRVEFELNRRLYRDTQVHELGHCLGLRHHFGGTADPGNYFDGYYTINERFPVPSPSDFDTDGTVGLNPDEQMAFEDAYEEATRLRELAGIDQWANSSVMDYTPNWYQRINGAGYHDFMAISFGYGDVVDIYDNTRAADGTARPPLPVDALTPVNTMRVGVKYYQGGEACESDAQCPYSATGSRSAELLPANTDSGLTQRCVPSERTDGLSVCSNFDDDARAFADAGGTLVPVDYFYCEDIRSSTRSLPGCAVFDEGDSFREIVRNQVAAYDRDYIFSAFRRFRRRFSTGNYFGRLIRFFDPLLGIYQNLIYRYGSDPAFREQEGPFGFEDEFLATADVMNLFARLLAQPSIGSYSYNAGWDRYELTSLDAEPDAQFVVPFGEGRYLNSVYQTGLSGIWRIERIGSIYDAILAMQLMTIRGLSPFYGADVVFQTNFYDIFPNEIQQIFTGMIAARPEEYMPRLEGCDGPSRRCPDGRVVYMDFYRGNCFPNAEGVVDPSQCRPPTDVTYQDLDVLNGGTRFFLQSYAAIFSLSNFPIYYDTTFQNQMFLCVEGQGDCNQPSPGSVEGVDFVRHTSTRFGKTFLAWQVDPQEGVAEQTSIAFAMVKEARDSAFIVEMLQKFRGDEGGTPYDVANLSAAEQAELAAIGYELPAAGDVDFEIDRLDTRLRSLEGFFFYVVQLERFYGIEFPAIYQRPEI
ncbi:MAG: hypothetical protein RID81_27765 [Sandaracinaceae bacterium]